MSGMQIRYSFSSMVLPAADPRGGSGGAPQTNEPTAQAQGRAPGALRSEPAGEAAAAVCSAPGFFLSAREHVKVWVRLLATPPPPSSQRSVLPERGVTKSGRKGDPLETALLGSPGRSELPPDQNMPGDRRGGKKERFPKIKTNAQKSPA